jgi:hypothetical protein
VAKRKNEIAASDATRVSIKDPPKERNSVEAKLMSREAFAKTAGPQFLPGDKKLLKVAEMPLSSGSLKGISKILSRPDWAKDLKKLLKVDSDNPGFITAEGVSLQRPMDHAMKAFNVTGDKASQGTEGFREFLRSAGVIKARTTSNWVGFEFGGRVTPKQQAEIIRIAKGKESVVFDRAKDPKALKGTDEAFLTDSMTLIKPTTKRLIDAIKDLNKVLP